MDCAFVHSKSRLCVDELTCFKRGGRVEQSKFKLKNQHFLSKLFLVFKRRGWSL